MLILYNKYLIVYLLMVSINDHLTNNTSHNDCQKETNTEFNFDNLPSGLRISTMTLTCNLNTLINIENVGNYIDITPGNIVCIKYGDNKIRTIIKLKKKNKRSNKKPQKNFYNQASMYIELNEKNGKRVNVKVFKNGAIQMTGCKTVDDFINAMDILCKELCKRKAVYDKTSVKIIKKEFVTNPENISSLKIHNFKILMEQPKNDGVLKMHNFKIRMINSNFKSGFMISRETMYGILRKANIRCTFEPCIHACVNIKHNYKNGEIVSIFVFESGSIIITGAKTKKQIIESYNFITKILYENFDNIVKNNIDDFLEKPKIKELIEKSIKTSLSSKTSLPSETLLSSETSLSSKIPNI